MSDWQVGDLAVCVDDSPCQCGCNTPVGLILRRIYRVTGVLTHVPKNDGVLRLALHGYKSPFHQIDAVGAFRFRKIRPDEHQACEPEFVKLLKRSKRLVPVSEEGEGA